MQFREDRRFISKLICSHDRREDRRRYFIEAYANSNQYTHEPVQRVAKQANRVHLGCNPHKIQRVHPAFLLDLRCSLCTRYLMYKHAWWCEPCQLYLAEMSRAQQCISLALWEQGSNTNACPCMNVGSLMKSSSTKWEFGRRVECLLVLPQDKRISFYNERTNARQCINIVCKLAQDYTYAHHRQVAAAFCKIREHCAEQTVPLWSALKLSIEFKLNVHYFWYAVCAYACLTSFWYCSLLSVVTWTDSFKFINLIHSFTLFKSKWMCRTRLLLARALFCPH